MTQSNWQKIVDSAFQLFMENGYKQTTTKEIARLAEVNESTVFRIFTSKEDLFHASISNYVYKSIHNDFNNLFYSDNLRQDVYYFVESIININIELIPTFRLLVKQAYMPNEVLNSLFTSLQKQQNMYAQYLIGLSHRYPLKELDYNSFIDALFSVIFYKSIYYLIEQSTTNSTSKSVLTEYFVNYTLNIISKENVNEAQC